MHKCVHDCEHSTAVLEAAASASEGYTAADLAAVCREAVTAAMQRAVRQVAIFFL